MSDEPKPGSTRIGFLLLLHALGLDLNRLLLVTHRYKLAPIDLHQSMVVLVLVCRHQPVMFGQNWDDCGLVHQRHSITANRLAAFYAYFRPRFLQVFSLRRKTLDFRR
jgi:hypothetical protein